MKRATQCSSLCTSHQVSSLQRQQLLHVLSAQYVLLFSPLLIGDHRLGAGSKLPVQPNLVYVVFVITSWISTSHRDSSFNQRMLKWSKCLTPTSLLISVSVSILSIKKLAVHMNPFWPWALQNSWAVLCSNKLG